MKIHYRFLGAACSAVLILGALTACQSSQSATSSNTAIVETEAPSAESQVQSEAGTITIEVTSVDGNNIEGTVGKLTQSQSGSGAPAGDPSSGEGTQGTPPSGDPPSGGGGQQPGGTEFVAGTETASFTVTDNTNISVEFLQGSQDGTIDSIVSGAVLEVTMDDGGKITDIVVKNLSAGGGFGGSGEVTQGTSASTIESDGTYSAESYESSGDDENALRIVEAKVTLDDITVNKSAGESSNTEDGDFYGQNAALLVTDGATATITNATISSTAVNGNGVFSYGSGTVVNIFDSQIRTVERNSGGIQTTGGATMNATNLDVETQGASAAAIRSDRGGGTVTVNSGTYKTSGTGSPAVYCTADITVSDATLTASASEAIVIEGKNNTTLNNCTTTGQMVGTYAADENQHIHNIMIYQSMSGDAEIGHATFTANGGSITSQSGDMFYVTNTSCDISLTHVALTLKNDILLSVEGNTSSNGWGTEGANGGTVAFTATEQELTGSIHVDEISSLDMTMSSNSTFKGQINADGQEGDVSVTIDSTSIWALTADSYITSFSGETSQINSNGFTLYVNGEALS